MTAKQGRLLSTAMMALIFAGIATGGAVELLHRRPPGELAPLLPGVILLILFASLRRRYARLEAEHGPGHEATRTSGRSLLVVAALALAIFAGVSVLLLASGR